jgi:thiaminase
LVANWTSPEFIRFVDALGDVVDGFLLQSSSSAWKSAERIWQRVLELEQAFWPEDGEECRMKITSA